MNLNSSEQSVPAVLHDEPWRPPLFLGDVAPHELEYAVKLQRALKPSLARLPHADAGLLTRGKLEQDGVEDYRREFGHSISERHFRTVFKRILQRAGRAGDYNRLELYLRENPAAKILHSGRTPDADGELRDLHSLIRGFKDPANPSPGEITSFWIHVFDCFQTQVDAGKPEKRLRKQYLLFLHRHAPWLARTPNALREAFRHKLESYRADGLSGVSDGRRERKGISTAKPYEERDIDQIVWHAHENCGGRIAQAVRELVEQERLGPEIERCLLASKSKSYVPRRLRAAVTPDVRMIQPYRLGQKAIDDATASLRLHYRGIHPMSILVADDVTLPVYFKAPDGKGGWLLGRGQCLIVIDFRTLMVLGFSLQPDKQYNTVVIRTILTRIFAERGMPRFLLLERGIWENTKLIDGGPAARRILRDQDMPYSWSECETGLMRFVEKIIHAHRARSKPVERVIGCLQDLMEGEPGYCGRDERKDLPAETKNRKLAFDAGRGKPDDFYTFDQWEERLAAIVERYNSVMQQGRRLNNISPEKAFEQWENRNDPPSRFDPNCAFYLAHHCIPHTVDSDGIVFTQRGQQFAYRNFDTSRLRYQKVLVWFNPLDPSFVTVTDTKRKNAFFVDRDPDVSGAVDITGETDDYEQALRNAREHSRYPEARYRVLKLKFKQTFRANVPHAPSIELGAQIERQKHVRSAAQRETTRRQHELSEVEAVTGIKADALRTQSAERQQAAIEFAKDMARKRQQRSPEGGITE